MVFDTLISDGLFCSRGSVVRDIVIARAFIALIVRHAFCALFVAGAFCALFVGRAIVALLVA